MFQMVCAQCECEYSDSPEALFSLWIAIAARSDEVSSNKFYEPKVGVEYNGMNEVH